LTAQQPIPGHIVVAKTCKAVNLTAIQKFKQP